MAATICSGGSFTSTPADGINGIVPAGTTYTWTTPTVTGGLSGGVAGSGGSISGTLTNPTSSAQSAVYTVTPVSGSCTGTNFTVTVTVNPMPSISAMTANVAADIPSHHHRQILQMVLYLQEPPIHGQHRQLRVVLRVALPEAEAASAIYLLIQQTRHRQRSIQSRQFREPVLAQHLP